MPYRSWSERRAKPRTYVGLWLRAGFLRQRELRKELQVTLNGGKPGWNNDEPAVVEFACQIALRRLFRGGCDASDIAGIVEVMREATGGDSPVDPLKAESMIRDALGEPDIDVKNIDPGQQFRLRYLIAVTAISLLESDEAAIDEIITDSERIAFERGWKPPIARDKSLRNLSE